MDFALISRLAGIILAPSNLLLLLLTLGVFLEWTHWKWFGRSLVTAVTVTLLFVFFVPVDGWLATPLENRFPRPPWPSHVEGVLVLGGGEHPQIFTTRGLGALDSEEGKQVAAVELARRYPGARILFSGGRAPLAGASTSEATVASAELRQLGLPPSRLILETRSRNTWENFVNSKRIAEPQPGEIWLVVTDAMSMPRAMGIAARLRWRVVPWPVGYVTTGRAQGMSWTSSLAVNLGVMEYAVHEWVGLAAYRFLGRLG